MSLADAKEKASVWLISRGYPEGSAAYQYQFWELTRLIWEHDLKQIQ